jgi:hypothetical protein
MADEIERKDAKAPSWMHEDPLPRRAPEPAPEPKVSVDPALIQSAASSSPPAAPAPGPASTVPTPPAPAAGATPASPASASVPQARPPAQAWSTSAPPASLAERRFDEPTDPALRRPAGRRILGLPLWGWVVGGLALIGALLLLADLRNRDRYVLVCKARTVELHQGRRFPWPFGDESVGGSEYKPVSIPAEADCRTRVFHSEEEAALGFLDLLLSQVRLALGNPGSANLKEARAQIQQALLLTRTHRGRRKEAQGMLADLSYREGRSGLARAENEIRLALSRFQEAQKLDGARFDDLDEWITHLEEMLRAIAPSPFSRAAGPTPGPRPRNPSSQPHGPTSRPKSLPVDRPPSPDAGPPATGGGILM